MYITIFENIPDRQKDNTGKSKSAPAFEVNVITGKNVALFYFEFQRFFVAFFIRDDSFSAINEASEWKIVLVARHGSLMTSRDTNGGVMRKLELIAWKLDEYTCRGANSERKIRRQSAKSSTMNK